MTRITSDRQQTSHYMDLLVGEVELGDRFNQYMYITQTSRQAELACAHFVSKMMTLRYPITRHNRNEVTINSQLFTFTSVPRLQQSSILVGRQVDRYFLDLPRELKEDIINRSPRFKEVRANMWCCLRNPGEQDIV